MSNNMDPFEEFEFKPITEGLGFHRTQKSLNQKSKVSSELLDEDSSSLFSTPLPKKSNVPNAFESTTAKTLNKSTDVVDEILKNIQATKKVNRDLLENHQATFKNSQKLTKTEYIKSNVLLSAIFLDMMLVVASTLLCLVLLLAVTKVDLLANLRNPDEKGFVYISTFCLLVTVGFVYYTSYRAFIGATPGEWAYDQKIQMNTNNDGFHIFKIVLRGLVIIFTGILFLPIFSWILNKDLAGDLIGLNLVKKV